MSQYAHASTENDFTDMNLLVGGVGSLTEGVGDQAKPKTALIFTKIGSQRMLKKGDAAFMNKHLVSLTTRLGIRPGVRFMVQCSVEEGSKKKIIDQFLACEQKIRAYRDRVDQKGFSDQDKQEIWEKVKDQFKDWATFTASSGQDLAKVQAVSMSTLRDLLPKEAFLNLKSNPFKPQFYSDMIDQFKQST